MITDQAKFRAERNGGEALEKVALEELMKEVGWDFGYKDPNKWPVPKITFLEVVTESEALRRAALQEFSIEGGQYYESDGAME